MDHQVQVKSWAVANNTWLIQCCNVTSQNYLSSTLQQMLPVYSVAQFSQTTRHYHYNIWTEKCSHRNASNVTDYNVNLFAAVKQKQSEPISQFCSITRHATSRCLSVICDGSIHWSLSNVTCWRTDTCICARLRLMTLEEQVSNISTHQRLTTTHECEPKIYNTHKWIQPLWWSVSKCTIVFWRLSTTNIQIQSRINISIKTETNNKISKKTALLSSISKETCTFFDFNC